MYCDACGEKLNDPELFCRKCGTESLAHLTEKDRPGPVRRAGYFSLGAAAFALLFLVVISLLSTFFPTLGSPQLTLLIMFLLGAAAAGSAAVLYARTRPGRGKNAGAATESPWQTAEPLALPSERFTRVPESVVDRTTDKLHVRRS